MITFRIRGRLLDERTRTPLPGYLVRAYDEDLFFDDFLGDATTDREGRFEIVGDLRDAQELFEQDPELYFKVYTHPGGRLVLVTDADRRRASSFGDPVELLVPATPGDPAADGGPRAVEFVDVDGEARDAFELGESLLLTAEGLRPITPHDLRVEADGRELFTARALTDARGVLPPTALWPQVGLDDPDSDARFTLEEAEARWAGRALRVTVLDAGKPVAELEARVERLASRSVGFSADAEGRLLNGFGPETEVGEVHLALANAFEGPARVYVVERQHGWRPGDPFRVATLADGREAVVEAELRAERSVVAVAEAAAFRPGAYDFVVRPVRYGREDDDLRVVRPDDVVVGRALTGLVVREGFMPSKAVLGGCVNKLPISGRSVAGAPYLRYADTFAVGEDVWGALDPGALDPGNHGKMCAFYVVPSKTAAQWGASTALNHLPVLGGNGGVQIVKAQAYCVNATKRLLWPSASLTGEYDIVADFGNNATSAAAFTPDASYDTPLDAIDGYFVAGFRVVEDPGTTSTFGHVGTWHYVESDVAALGGGLTGTVTVQDENTAYATPGGFATLNRSVGLKAHVYYPADSAGQTGPGGLSAAQANYPLVVVVHGNGQDYTAYDFLLAHLARNGFIAASVDGRFLSGGTPSHGMHGLGRANVFFRHLAVLQQAFGASLQNNIGVMGHSRGGEATLKIARLNQAGALGHNINAILPLAPTDQYGTEVLAGAHATPALFLYGSRDGDIAGWSPYAGYDVRQTAFSLYDRAAGADKSLVFVYRATHNGFITTNYDNPFDTPLPPADQRPFVTAYANAFFRWRLLGEAQWRGVCTGDWRPPSTDQTGAEYYVSYRATTRRTVDDFETGASWQTSSLGGAVTQTGLPATPAEGRLYDNGTPTGLDPQSPHDTRGLKLRWNSSGDRLEVAIPAAQKDVSGYAALSVRVAQTQGSPHNPANQPQDFRLALRDGSGNERQVRVGKFATVPYPDQRANASLRLSALTTVRIPLPSYTIVCAGQAQVDLTDVVAVALVFEQTPQGEIEIDDLEFTA